MYTIVPQMAVMALGDRLVGLDESGSVCHDPFPKSDRSTTRHAEEHRARGRARRPAPRAQKVLHCCVMTFWDVKHMSEQADLLGEPRPETDYSGSDPRCRKSLSWIMVDHTVGFDPRWHHKPKSQSKRQAQNNSSGIQLPLQLVTSGVHSLKHPKTILKP